MLKAQDCMLLLKLLANPGIAWSQRQLAKELFISLAEINGGIKRLLEANLLRKDKDLQFVPNLAAAEEFLISGLKYVFPAKLGEYTRGIPTAYATPLFSKIIVLGDDPIPIWPYILGERQGVALKPIHPSVPKSLHQNPDNAFYEFLVLVDTIRIGKARERNLAIKMIKDKINYECSKSENARVNGEQTGNSL